MLNQFYILDHWIFLKFTLYLIDDLIYLYLMFMNFNSSSVSSVSPMWEHLAIYMAKGPTGRNGCVLILHDLVCRCWSSPRSHLIVIFMTRLSVTKIRHISQLTRLTSPLSPEQLDLGQRAEGLRRGYRTRKSQLSLTALLSTVCREQEPEQLGTAWFRGLCKTLSPLAVYLSVFNKGYSMCDQYSC